MMTYKGYVGKVEFDEEAGIFHGDVINTRDVITFQGDSVASLKEAFQESIEDYLDFCKQRNEEPEKPFSGQFVTRIPPALHRQVNMAAAFAGKSLNAWVAEQLESAVLNEVSTTQSVRKKRTKARAKVKSLKKPASKSR